MNTEKEKRTEEGFKMLEPLKKWDWGGWKLTNFSDGVQVLSNNEKKIDIEIWGSGKVYVYRKDKFLFSLSLDQLKQLSSFCELKNKGER